MACPPALVVCLVLRHLGYAFNLLSNLLEADIACTLGGWWAALAVSMMLPHLLRYTLGVAAVSLRKYFEW